MSFRTVVINSHCKLETKMNYLVCRGEETKRFFLDEISMLIIHSTAVALTTALVCELVKRNINIIFCDEKHNPLSSVSPYYGSYNCALKVEQQINWAENVKKEIWTRIIKQKIYNQGKVLQKLGFESESQKMFEYSLDVKINDVTNREGHAAKLYFATLFSKDWNRDCGDFYSKALNYGYTVLLSAFNREIASQGYLTQLGIWHKNQYNNFNLSCDLMEPFRVIVDNNVLELKKDEQNYKRKILDVFNQKIVIDNKEMFLENAIQVYVRSVFNSLNQGDESLIKFYEV